MIHCLVLGDSIAVGVGTARPDCTTTARIGITSEAFVQTMLTPEDADTLIVSLGANDDGTVHTEDNLRQLRQTIRARTVIWLLPGLKDPQRAVIRAVALSYNDRVIDTRPQAGPDHLHPSGTGYRIIADETEQQGPDAIEVAEAEAPRSSFNRASPYAYRLTPYSYRQTEYRLTKRRIAAERSRSGLPLPPAPPALSLAHHPHVLMVRASERTVLSDGRQCITLGTRVSCQFSPRPTTLIDPARDHRKTASRQALAN